MQRRWPTILRGVAVAVLVAACQPIANMPVELRDEISSAAQQMTSEYDDPGDATFEFREVHCRADGHLLIVFRHTSGTTAGATATAMTAIRGPSAWEVNYWADTLDADIAAFFAATPEVACPPGPG